MLLVELPSPLRTEGKLKPNGGFRVVVLRASEAAIIVHSHSHSQTFTESDSRSASMSPYRIMGLLCSADVADVPVACGFSLAASFASDLWRFMATGNRKEKEV